MVEPLDVYFSDWGEEILFGGVPIIVIFDREFIQDMGYGIGVANAAPMFICKSNDVPEESHGLVVNIRGKDYRVASDEPDGTGMTIVRLGAKGGTSSINRY